MEPECPRGNDLELSSPLTRNRLLAAMGAGLFGFATKAVLRQDPALANHITAYQGCYGFGMCHCCSGSTCTCGGCRNVGYLGCETGGQCWTACVSGTLYQCCDWRYTSSTTSYNCICRGAVGTC